MGKDLNGTELGKGFLQEKTGLYAFRKRTNKGNMILRSKTLAGLMGKIEKLEAKNKGRNVNYKTKNAKEYKDCICVYFITDGEFVMIGVTENLVKRIAALQTANPRKLELLNVVETENPFQLESALHKVFQHRNVGYEWFDILDLFAE